MMVYKFKDAAHLPKGLDAQAIGDRLAELRESEGAGFTTTTIVKAARSKSSPLHPAFTWDDRAAAEEYRLMEAGHLQRSLVTIETDRLGATFEVRAFVPVTIRNVDEQRFLPTSVAMADEEYRTQILERALSELLAARRKYRDIEEFARIWEAIDRTARGLHKAA